MGEEKKEKAGPGKHPSGDTEQKQSGNPDGGSGRPLIIMVFVFPTVEMEDDDFTASLSKQSCITEQTQYFFDNDSKSFSGVLDCGNCSR